MHLTISYEEPQGPKVNDNTKAKITKYFLELTIAILVKFWNIQSHIFFLYIWYSLVFTNFGIFPLYLTIKLLATLIN